MNQPFLPLLLLFASPLPALAAQGSLAPDTFSMGTTTAAADGGASSSPVGFDLTPDHVFFDAPGDGYLWARGASYKASFGADGATYIPFLGSDAPRNFPVRMQLTSATLGGTPLQLTDRATWSRDGSSVTLERGEVDVRYHLGLDGIEQTFVLDRLPLDGDLLVRLAVDSELEGRTVADGFRFAGERGGVNYGTVTVLDGAGRSLAVGSRLEQGEITIEVPRHFLASATLPVVVDPLITTFTVDGTSVDTWRGDVAFDKSFQRYLHAFTYDFSQADADVYSVTIDESGTPILADAAWINLSSADWRNVSVANNNAANNFLVTSNVMVNNTAQVWSRLRQLPGPGMGTPRRLNVGGNYCGTPSVGGDGNEGAGSLYCVAWGESLGNDNGTINYAMLNSNGTIASSAHVLAHSVSTLPPRVDVSNSNGSGVLIYRAWNVVWDTRAGAMDYDIYGAQIASNGNILRPSYPIDTTPVDHFKPSVSAPLDTALGGAPDYLVVYETGVFQDHDLHARLFKGSTFVKSFDLTAMEAALIGQQHLAHDQLNPTVVTDGDQFIVAYGETSGQAQDEDIYVSTLAHMGSDLFLTETHVSISSGVGKHHAPNIATARDSGDSGSRSAFVAWVNSIYTGNAADQDTKGGIYRTPSGWANIGMPLCNGSTNSTGTSSTMRAFGSDDPALNHFFLDVDNLPAFQWGHFLMSQTQASIPVSHGILCLGGPQFRLGSTLANSWVQGAVGRQLDLTTLPPNATVLEGQSWNFQFWHRDAGGSNLSNAVTVNF